MSLVARIAPAAVLFLALACGDEGGTLTLGGNGGDIITAPDGATPGVDATTPGVDTGTSTTDPGGGTPGTDESGTPASDTTPAKDPGGTVAPPVSGDVSLRAADKTRIQAVYDPAEGSTAGPAVLLIHDYMADSKQWDASVESLRERGYHVLRIDLRGHGRSDPYGKPALPLIQTDPDAAPQDVDAGLEWLEARPEVDGDRIGIVGAGLGANLAFVAMSKDAARGAAAISPRIGTVLSLAGVTRKEDLSFGPVLCIAGEDDGGGTQKATCEDLQLLAQEPHPVEIVPESEDHGYTLIEKDQLLWGKILDFLDEAVTGQ